MKNFIFDKIIQPLFRRHISTLVRSAEIQQSRKDAEHRDNNYKVEYHNQLVISIGQSDINPVVGYVFDWTDRVPHIKDILSGEELVCFGKLFIYSERIIRILDYINPEDRYAIVTGITSGKFIPRKDERQLTADEIISRVNIFKDEMTKGNIDEKIHHQGKD